MTIIKFPSKRFSKHQQSIKQIAQTFEDQGFSTEISLISAALLAEINKINSKIDRINKKIKQ